MGLSFHYSTRIREPQFLKTLTEEVADICDSMKWEYRIWEEQVKTPVPIANEIMNNQRLLFQGISFNPPESEPVWLTFVPSGRAISLIPLINAEIYVDEPELIYTISVKTQFAGVDTHIAILTLLKYLEKKYLADMEVNDEGYYWKTMDKRVLENRFKEYQAVFDMVQSTLESATFTDTDNTASLADQLIALLQKRLGTKEK